MPSDERLSLLLSTLAQVALSVELQPTLQILLDSLQTLVPFDAAGIFVRDAEPERTMVYVNAGHLPPLVVRKNGAVESLAVTGPRKRSGTRARETY